LALRELDDGRVLVHCFAGCAAEDVLAAMGLTFEAVFPERAMDFGVTGQRRPWLPADVFEIARREITIAAVIASDMRLNRAISAADYERLFIAAARLQNIAEACYGR
jgi:hypothetical protein